MSSLPPAIFFINGDITYPPVPPPTPPTFIGENPAAPNSDASVSELTHLQIQLYINDTMTKAEFDARVAADPNYPTIIHLQGLRILVILPTFQDMVNRQYADVVMFLHQGMADIESNRFWDNDHDEPHPHTFPPPVLPEFPHVHHHGVAVGPPGQSYDIQRITMYSLLRAAHSHNVVNLPFDFMPHCQACNYPFFCDRCHTFSGIRICGRCNSNCKCFCNLVDNQGVPSSPVHLPNCDNEYHNPKFIHRK